MKTIDDYLDKAKHNHNLKSDRQLSIMLGVTGNYVTFYRTKRSWPSDALMIKIADLAGEDQTEALINLNIWRNSDSAAAPLYSRLLDKLKVAAMLCIATGFIALSVASLPGYETVDLVAWGADQYIL